VSTSQLVVVVNEKRFKILWCYLYNNNSLWILINVNQILYIIFFTCQRKENLYVEPRKRLSTLGETVLIKCRSSDTVYWSFNNGKLPENVKTVASYTDSDLYILIITSFTIHNSGIYTCYGKDATFGHPFDESSSITVQGESFWQLYCTRYLPLHLYWVPNLKTWIYHINFSMVICIVKINNQSQRVQKLS